MKKIIMFLILLLMPVVVSANDGPFSKAFSTNDASYTFHSTPFKEGYVFVEVDKEDTSKTYLRYYDNKGELKKEIEYAEGDYVYTLFTIGDYLYVLKSSPGGVNNRILRYDSDFNLLKELTYESDEFNPFIRQNHINTLLLHINYRESVSLKDNKIYLPDWYNEYIAVIEEDLSSSTIQDLSYVSDLEWYEALNEHYPVYSILSELMNSFVSLQNSLTMDYATPVVYNDDYYFVNSRNNNCNGAAEVEESCFEDKIFLLDKDYNVVWEKELATEIAAVQYAVMLDDYIVISAISKENNYLQVYDFEGNLVQEFSTGSPYKIYGALYKIPSGFVATVSNKNPLFFIGDNTNSPSNADDNVLGQPFNEYNEIYVFNNPIETATSGKGSINTPTRAFPGETVTIEVTPEKGYTLSELIVIDEAGNQLKVTNNTFVMGASKVTVRAVFVPENPNTGNVYIILICLVATLTGIACLFQKRKLDFLK